MFKVTFSCVVVSLIIVDSCLAISKQSALPESHFKVNSSSITDAIIKHSKNAQYYISLLTDTANEYMSRECNKEQGILSSLLNYSMESIFKRFLERYKTSLIDIHIPEIPAVYHKFSNNESFVEIKLKNISLKNLDTGSINKFKYDICKLYNEIDVTLPQLDMVASYTLNGIIDNSTISGAGNLKLLVKSATYSEISFVNCTSNIFSAKGCSLNNMNVTLDIGIKEVTVDFTGVKYKNLTDSKFNEELNTYIREYIKTHRPELKQIVKDMILKYKHQRGETNLNPLKMLARIEEYFEQLF